MMSLLIFVFVACSAARGFKSSTSAADMKYGYFPKPGDSQSQFFYSLYPNANASAPLVLWLQGGPGGSSLFGDFLENGPIDVYGKARPTAWTNLASMLYVDNPIGTGFSYTTDNGFSTTDEDIATNLVNFFAQFFEAFPAYQKTPFWMFTESYGGKMTAITAVALHKAIANGTVKANLQGVALGDGWLAPVDCMASYAPYLTALSLVDEEQAAKISEYAVQAAAVLATNNGTGATDLWGEQQQYIEQACDQCNFYNAINSTNSNADEAQLAINMAPGGSFFEIIKSVIPSGVSYGSQSNEVFSKLSDAFMRPGVWAVEYLLANNVHVNVYSGQLDLIVDALCTEQWINNMSWPGLAQWQQQPEVPLNVDSIPEGFGRVWENFAFYKIFRASHMVPRANPSGAYLMFKEIINGPNKK